MKSQQNLATACCAGFLLMCCAAMPPTWASCVSLFLLLSLHLLTSTPRMFIVACNWLVGSVDHKNTREVSGPAALGVSEVAAVLEVVELSLRLPIRFWTSPSIEAIKSPSPSAPCFRASNKEINRDSAARTGSLSLRNCLRQTACHWGGFQV